MVSPAGLLRAIDYPGDPAVDFTYDQQGRRLSMTDATGTTLWTYDDAGLPLTETQPLTGRRLTHTHDAYGQRTALEVASTTPTTAPYLSAPWRTGYTYDSAGRLRTVLDPRAAAAPYLYAYPAPRELGAINALADGPRPLPAASHDTTTITTPFGQVLRTTRDPLGRTRSVEAFGSLLPAPGSPLVSHAYTYNAIGQRVREVTPEADLSYGYDQYRQVVTATDAQAPVAYDFGYDYDPIGNRLSATIADPAVPGALATATYGTANALNQYTEITVGTGTPFVPLHDANGNTRTEPGFFHIYDEQDRLVESIDTAQTRRVLQTYDGFGRRVERREQQRASTSDAWSDTSRVRYVYDGWRVLEELAWDSSTSTFLLNASYTRGVDLSGTPEGAGGIGGQLARVTPAETGPRVGSYFHDANGNVVALLGTDGTALARYRYSPFGETLSATGVWAQDNLYRFSAKEHDPFTGHYYYGFRYYNPQTGRWPSRDPIAENGGVNLYGMIKNNTVMGIDVLGLFLLPGIGGVDTSDISLFPNSTNESVINLGFLPEGTSEDERDRWDAYLRNTDRAKGDYRRLLDFSRDNSLAGCFCKPEAPSNTLFRDPNKSRSMILRYKRFDLPSPTWYAVYMASLKSNYDMLPSSTLATVPNAPDLQVPLSASEVKADYRLNKDLMAHRAFKGINALEREQVRMHVRKEMTTAKADALSAVVSWSESFEEFGTQIVRVNWDKERNCWSMQDSYGRPIDSEGVARRLLGDYFRFSGLPQPLGL